MFNLRDYDFFVVAGDPDAPDWKDRIVSDLHWWHEREGMKPALKMNTRVNFLPNACYVAAADKAGELVWWMLIADAITEGGTVTVSDFSFGLDEP